MVFTAILDKLSPKHLLLLAACFSLAMLAAALVAQYAFGLHPCHLCILQRYPYGAIAGIGLLAAWRGSKNIQLIAAFLCAALFFTDAGIAFYHTGVEYGWFPGPSGCTNSATGGESIEELRAQIMNAPLVSCDQAMIHVLGLSMAAWNFLAAFAAGISTLYISMRLRKKI